MKHSGIVLTCGLVISACGQDPAAPRDAAAFALTADSIQLLSGVQSDVFALPRYVPFGTELGLAWSSSDTAVAVVEAVSTHQARVTGRRPGSAFVRALRTLDGHTATDSVHVLVEPIPDKQVGIIPAVATMLPGSSLQFLVSGVAGGFYCTAQATTVIAAETNEEGCLVRAVGPGQSAVRVTTFAKPEMWAAASITVAWPAQKD